MTVNWGTAQAKCSLFGGRLATLRTLDDMIFVNGYRVTRHGKLRLNNFLHTTKIYKKGLRKKNTENC